VWFARPNQSRRGCRAPALPSARQAPSAFGSGCGAVEGSSPTRCSSRSPASSCPAPRCTRRTASGAPPCARPSSPEDSTPGGLLPQVPDTLFRNPTPRLALPHFRARLAMNFLLFSSCSPITFVQLRGLRHQSEGTLVPPILQPMEKPPSASLSSAPSTTGTSPEGDALKGFKIVGLTFLERASTEP